MIIFLLWKTRFNFRTIPLLLRICDLQTACNIHRFLDCADDTNILYKTFNSKSIIYILNILGQVWIESFNYYWMIQF